MCSDGLRAGGCCGKQTVLRADSPQTRLGCASPAQAATSCHLDTWILIMRWFHLLLLALANSPTTGAPVVVRIRALQTDSPRNPAQRSYWMLQERPGTVPNATSLNGRCDSGGGASSTPCAGFTATAVLRLIERLKPTKLERFVSGQQDLHKLVHLPTKCSTKH